MGRIALIVLLSLGLAGCSSSLNPFKAKPPERLKGERISVMLANPDLDPDPAVADLQVVLPPPKANESWPQPGGSASHMMGHPALGNAPKRVWSVSIGAGSNRRRRLLAAPVVADGTVFAMDAENKVSAFDAKSGGQIWSLELQSKEEDGGDLGGGLAYDGGRLYVTTGFAMVIALDAKTGKEIWRQSAGAPMRAGPTVAGGTVFALTVDNRLVALRAEDGREIWHHAGLTEVASILGGASPAVDGDIVIVPNSSGELFALRTDNGRPLWSETLAAIRRIDAVSQLADIRGDPVIEGGLVFAMSHSGRMVAVNARTGGRIWDKQIGGIQTPWLAGDYLFAINSDGMVFALLKSSGRIRWVRQLQRYEDPEDKKGPIIWAGPVLVGDRLIVAGSQGEALSISPYTGKILGRLELPDNVLIAPIVANRTLYFLTDDAELLAYR